ncbi:hypothetical protein [Vibrio agarivorans]|uniref:Uncharacterized protein n=1 Tax=Vibrio agarivorans TaxID=153622 RepID=A0ABT7Y7L6_9VIBR|nr:hypothetical protein [Vibrio agarivorans]MDN2483950.1 hypothetical protein [Vibrio agarivorans]
MTSEREWRKIAKTQLALSGLPTVNEMEYRPYLTILFNLSLAKFGHSDYAKINIGILQAEVQCFTEQNRGSSHQPSLLWYALALLNDYLNQRKSNPFMGTVMDCGSCGASCFYHEESNRYSCCMCEASAEAGANRLPRAIPVIHSIRIERVRLHKRLDDLYVTSSERFKFYSHIASYLKQPLEHTHIGQVCSAEDVEAWDKAITNIEQKIERFKGV